LKKNRVVGARRLGRHITGPNRRSCRKPKKKLGWARADLCTRRSSRTCSSRNTVPVGTAWSGNVADWLGFPEFAFPRVCSDPACCHLQPFRLRPWARLGASCQTACSTRRLTAVGSRQSAALVYPASIRSNPASGGLCWMTTACWWSTPTGAQGRLPDGRVEQNAAIRWGVAAAPVTDPAENRSRHRSNEHENGY